MHNPPVVSPKDKADELRKTYGGEATFKASLEAHKAIESEDMSGCMFWNQVIKILDGDNIEEFRSLRKNRNI